MNSVMSTSPAVAGMGALGGTSIPGSVTPSAAVSSLERSLGLTMSKVRSRGLMSIPGSGWPVSDWAVSEPPPLSEPQPAAAHARTRARERTIVVRVFLLSIMTPSHSNFWIRDPL